MKVYDYFSLSFEVDGSDQKVEGRGVWGPSPNRGTGGSAPVGGPRGQSPPAENDFRESLDPLGGLSMTLFIPLTFLHFVEILFNTRALELT